MNQKFIFKIVVTFLLIFVSVFKVEAQQFNVLGWAWSETIGWISFNSETDTQSSVKYGVEISTSTGYLSGYAWSENIGWISFNRNETGAPPSDDPCPTGSCIAKVQDPKKIGLFDVKIIGWARVLSVTSSDNSITGGWDGWIKLGDDQNSWPSQISIASNGDFHGWAWSAVNSASSSVLGWISFNSSDPGAGGSYKVWLEFPGGYFPIEINFNWRPQKPFVRERVKFINETQCPLSVNCQYNWEFQDATPSNSNEKEPIVVFSSSGEKNVTLKVTLPSGLSNSLTKTIKILPRAVPTGSIFEEFFAKISSFLKRIF